MINDAYCKMNYDQEIQICQASREITVRQFHHISHKTHTRNLITSDKIWVTHLKETDIIGTSHKQSSLIRHQLNKRAVLSGVLNISSCMDRCEVEEINLTDHFIPSDIPFHRLTSKSVQSSPMTVNQSKHSHRRLTKMHL